MSSLVVYGLSWTALSCMACPEQPCRVWLVLNSLVVYGLSWTALSCMACPEQPCRVWLVLNSLVVYGLSWTALSCMACPEQPCRVWLVLNSLVVYGLHRRRNRGGPSGPPPVLGRMSLDPLLNASPSLGSIHFINSPGKISYEWHMNDKYAREWPDSGRTRVKLIAPREDKNSYPQFNTLK